MMHSMPYWDSRVAEMARQFPDVEVEAKNLTPDMGGKADSTSPGSAIAESI